MAHGDTQIHAALVTALTGLTTTGANVFDDETTPIPEASLPALRVLDDGVGQIEYATQRPPRTLLRTQSYTVRALCKISNAKAKLNTMLGEVETAIYANRTLGGIARDVRVETYDKSFSDELETRVGEAPITIVVDWVCIEGSPQTPT